MSLKELLQGREIKCAHIVDDAFDEAPTSGLNEDSIALIFAKIKNSDYEALAKAFSVSEDDEAEVKSMLADSEAFAVLYAKRSEFTEELNLQLFAEFETDRVTKRKQLEPLLEVLEAAGIECCKSGVDYKPQDLPQPQLFFVDLKLRDNSLRMAHEDARDALVKLTGGQAHVKPFIFLMSSQEMTLSASREDFRKSASLFQSQFESVEKTVFSDKPEFERMLARYTEGMEAHAALHAKMSGVKTAVEKAAETVLEELRALDFADYFVLAKNTASVEKIDLGSYVVELLLEFLANEVEGKEGVWALATQLNDLKLAKLPRVRFGWSAPAKRLYSASMLHNREMLAAEERMGNGPANGHFFTGDIYFDAKDFNKGSYARALAVITPACDLVRPQDMKGKSVVLCEGKVATADDANPQLTAPDGLSVTLMPDPKDHAKFLTVVWNKKKIHVWDDDARALFSKQECSFVRVGRLRPLYALQLQQKVTTDLSRVGTQKPPSALNLRAIRCMVSDGSKWVEVYFDASSDAAGWLISDESTSKKKVNVVTVLLSDHTVQNAYRKVREWLANNPEVRNRDILVRLLQDDAREVFRGARGILPNGKDEDATLYPLAEHADIAVQKALAVVHFVSPTSAYAHIKDGAAVKDNHPAAIVFKLEEIKAET